MDTTTTESEREKFEAWALPRGFGRSSQPTSWAWEGWQAARASGSAAPTANRWETIPSMRMLDAANHARPACSPALTECPRCKNDISKCDGAFAKVSARLVALADELDGEADSGAKWSKAQHTCVSVGGTLRSLASAVAELESTVVNLVSALRKEVEATPFDPDAKQLAALGSPVTRPAEPPKPDSVDPVERCSSLPDAPGESSGHAVEAPIERPAAANLAKWKEAPHGIEQWWLHAPSGLIVGNAGSTRMGGGAPYFASANGRAHGEFVTLKQAQNAAMNFASLAASGTPTEADRAGTLGGHEGAAPVGRPAAAGEGSAL